MATTWHTTSQLTVRVRWAITEPSPTTITITLYGDEPKPEQRKPGFWQRLRRFFTRGHV